MGVATRVGVGVSSVGVVCRRAGILSMEMGGRGVTDVGVAVGKAGLSGIAFVHLPGKT